MLLVDLVRGVPWVWRACCPWEVGDPIPVVGDPAEASWGLTRGAGTAMVPVAAGPRVRGAAEGRRRREFVEGLPRGSEPMVEPPLGEMVIEGVICWSRYCGGAWDVAVDGWLGGECKEGGAKAGGCARVGGGILGFIVSMLVVCVCVCVSVLYYIIYGSVSVTVCLWLKLLFLCVCILKAKEIKKYIKRAIKKF